MAEPLPTDDVFRWLDALGSRGIAPGLSRIAALCAALGQPERKFPSVLVAGTNGKGSTAATLDAILREAGVRGGFYSSPHLVRLNERLRIGGADVETGPLGEALERVRRIVESPGAGAASDATWFEVMTAAAFVVLAEEKVDLAILEVGLGGRCDATNLAPAIVSVITPIGLDHTEVLGTSIGAIAREKAGIIKTARPVVVAPQPPEAESVIREVAAGVRAPMELVDRESVLAVSTSATGTRLQLATAFGPLELESPLAGAHQAINVAVAVAAAAKLSTSGFPSIDAGAVRRGVFSTRWPGRLERRSSGGRLVFVDGGHNPHGAAAVAAFLDTVGLSGRFVLVVGVLADKDVAGLVAPLARRALAVVTTKPPSPRGRPADQTADVVRRERGDVPLAAEDDPGRALDLAREFGARGEPIVVVGSLVLAGDVIRRLDDEDAAAVPPSR